MSDDAQKKPVTETAMRDVKEELAALQKKLSERNARDSRQSEEIRALKAERGHMDRVIDFTSDYPKTSCAIGLVLLVVGLAFFSGVKLYICVGGCVAFVPGLLRKAMDAFKAWKNGNGTSGPAGT